MLHISQPFSCPGPTRMSLHYLERDEVNGLKLLRRQQQAKWRKRAYVFINERPPALRPDGPAASPSSLVRSGERMVSDRPRRGHAACPRGRNVGTVNTWHGADEGKAVFGDRPEARLPRFDRRRGERGLSNNRLCPRPVASDDLALCLADSFALPLRYCCRIYYSAGVSRRQRLAR